MILRDLVGGGGKAKSSFVITEGPCGADLFFASPDGDVGDAGLYEESEPLAEGVSELALALSVSWNALGGRWKMGAA